MISRIIRKVFVTTFHILAVINSIQGFSNDCHDSSHYVAECPQWALNGQCTKSSEFMKKFCKKSCNECPMSLDSVGLVRARSFSHQQGTVHSVSIHRVMHIGWKSLWLSIRLLLQILGYFEMQKVGIFQILRQLMLLGPSGFCLL